MNESLSGKKMMLLFTVFTLFCLGFYTMGLYIGKMSRENPATAATSNLKSTEIATEQPSTRLIAEAQDLYSIQIAATASQEEAKQLLEQLYNAGFESAHIVKPQDMNLYAVRVGPFKLETAEQIAAKLQNFTFKKQPQGHAQ
ncbi:MAG: SPOR domain-containing protein [Acidobacteriota bacterium]|nr:SPOR domain-containing protein [Blastocatellia bacterium]MDW8413618.1 SPOR domain-containing protein [Acidobacteriota bacterium]